MKKLVNAIKKVINKIISLDFLGMAAEMAFNFIFAIIPFFIFLIAVFGLLGSEGFVDRITRIISVVIPVDIMSIIENALNEIVETSSLGLLTFGFVVALWSAAKATNIILKSVNKVYKLEETRSYWKIKAISLAMVIILTIALFISVNLIVFGRIILEFMQNFVAVSYNVQDILLFIRWPVAFFTLFIMAVFVYYMAPNIKDQNHIKLLSSIPGSIFFCVFWLLVSWGFGLYVENFGNYNETFGFLGGVMILLTWLYLSSLIILTGGAINSLFYER